MIILFLCFRCRCSLMFVGVLMKLLPQIFYHWFDIHAWSCWFISISDASSSTLLWCSCVCLFLRPWFDLVFDVWVKSLNFNATSLTFSLWLFCFFVFVVVVHWCLLMSVFWLVVVFKFVHDSTYCLCLMIVWLWSTCCLDEVLEF